jgi:hypothetical protein
MNSTSVAKLQGIAISIAPEFSAWSGNATLENLFRSTKLKGTIE